jgi:hypothetical protein
MTLAQSTLPHGGQQDAACLEPVPDAYAGSGKQGTPGTVICRLCLPINWPIKGTYFLRQKPPHQILKSTP